jgi:hypothetical protein
MYNASMSYQYFVHPEVPVTSKLAQLQADLGLYIANPHHLERLLPQIDAALSVRSEVTYAHGYPTLLLRPGLKAVEHEGFEALIGKLQATLFKYADTGSYEVLGEYDETQLVTVL